ncbi:MAG: metal-sensing transcriptional repressor [bacterium]
MSNSSNSTDTKKIQVALKKSIGSTNKALKLLLDSDYLECSDLLVQIDSAIGSLQSSRSQVLNHFLDVCIDENIKSGDKTKLKNQLTKLYKLTK